MQVVILVGGEGTRLRPLTCNTPKAIVPILNRPFLEHLLLYLKGHGVTDVILAMGYLPNLVQGCLGDGSRLGMRITYVTEKSPLGTAGAVKHAESFIDGPFIVLNGDIITEIDLTDMIKQHQTIKPKVSLALTPVEDPTAFGVVDTDARNIVKRFLEKPSRDKVTSNMINAGIYILEAEVLTLIPDSTRFMFEHDVFPTLIERGDPILGYPSDAYWIDIGTSEKYLEVNHHLLQRWDNGGVRIEGKSQIHPTAHIEGPVLIGDGCVISARAIIKGPAVLGPQCRIGRDTIIDGVVLWQGVEVLEGAVLDNCVAGFNSRIQGNCHIGEECILGDYVNIDSESQLTQGTRVWPDNYPDPDAIKSGQS